jgi:hypothetical protein
LDQAGIMPVIEWRRGSGYSCRLAHVLLVKALTWLCMTLHVEFCVGDFEAAAFPPVTLHGDEVGYEVENPAANCRSVPFCFLTVASAHHYLACG